MFMSAERQSKGGCDGQGVTEVTVTKVTEVTNPKSPKICTNGVKVAVKEFAKMSMEWQNEGGK